MVSLREASRVENSREKLERSVGAKFCVKNNVKCSSNSHHSKTCCTTMLLFETGVCDSLHA